jgi:hypothetical protein
MVPAGVPHPLHDLACGVVKGQTAALSVEGIVLGSANSAATYWGRNARSDTVRTDGRSALPLHLLAARCDALPRGRIPDRARIGSPAVRLSLPRGDHGVLYGSGSPLAAIAIMNAHLGVRR